MEMSLTANELVRYVTSQVNTSFPDQNPVRENTLARAIDLALDRLDYCFKHIKLPSYRESGSSRFSHLHSDQYLVFLWFLSNTVWSETGLMDVSTKLYYLNKVLHGFDCYFDNPLPDIFFVAHGTGTVLGKARYGDFFYVSKGCTVGANRGFYPVIGKGVGLGAGSSVIGSCRVGDLTSIGAGTHVFDRDVGERSVIFRNVAGQLECRVGDKPLAALVFDLPQA